MIGHKYAPQWRESAGYDLLDFEGKRAIVEMAQNILFQYLTTERGNDVRDTDTTGASTRTLPPTRASWSRPGRNTG